MKAVILAGGYGTRISEETYLKPKPMVEIGGMPILWHIMKIYSNYGINDFIICCGYKGYIIKEYFKNYSLHMSDVTFDIFKNSMKVHKKKAENWKITLVDTGEKSNTGGRLKRVAKYLKNEKNFCFTYGDGLSDVNISETIKFHLKNKKLVTLTGVQVPGRYGSLNCDGDLVKNFVEKPKGENSYINGGFFVMSTKVLNYIEGDKTSWEAEPLKYFAKKKQLVVYKHKGFWQSMDTLRDKNYLENIWSENKAPWKSWG